AALDHEVGDDAMKLDAIVEWLVLLFGGAAILRVVLGPLGQTDKIGDRERGLLEFKLANDFSLRRVEFGVNPVGPLRIGRVRHADETKQCQGGHSYSQNVQCVHSGRDSIRSFPTTKEIFSMRCLPGSSGAPEAGQSFNRLAAPRQCSRGSARLGGKAPCPLMQARRGKFLVAD